MVTMTSEITNPTEVYSTVYSVRDQRKYQGLCEGIHRGQVNYPHKRQVTWKSFRLMTSSWDEYCRVIRYIFTFDYSRLPVMCSLNCDRLLINLFRDILIALNHDDVIKWTHFPLYWPFVRRINRFSVNSPHKGQWREDLMFSLIWKKNGWDYNREAGDLRRHRAHCDVIVMWIHNIMRIIIHDLIQMLQLTASIPHKMLFFWSF